MPHFGELQTQLHARVQPITVTLGASPATYTADRTGALVLYNAVAPTLALSRDGGATSVTLGTFNGAVPMQIGDQLIVTYANLPTTYFLPS